MFKILATIGTALLLLCLPVQAFDGVVSGMINSVDTAQTTISLDGVPYSYDDDNIVVFSADNEPMNIQALIPGTPVLLFMTGPNSDEISMIQVERFEDEDDMDAVYDEDDFE